MAPANIKVTLPDISEALRARLQRADEAIADYDAMQHIIVLLLERLGGSASFSLESLVTKRPKTVVNHIRDEVSGAVTFSLGTKEGGTLHA